VFCFRQGHLVKQVSWATLWEYLPYGANWMAWGVRDSAFRFNGQQEVKPCTQER